MALLAPDDLAGRDEDGWQALAAIERDEQIRLRGQALFRAIFRDDVLACLGQSLVEARHSNCGLRINLRLSEAPELIALPWEYLFHPALDRFLVLSAETTLVHYLDLPRKAPPLSVSLPLHILVVMATPKDLPTLDSEKEWRVLQDAMRRLIKTGVVTLDRLDMASLHDFQRRLRTRPYHVLHFVGHGALTGDTGEGTLMFCGQDGCADPVRARDLALVVSDAPSLRLVVLNGCQGARAPRPIRFLALPRRWYSRGRRQYWPCIQRFQTRLPSC